MRVTTKSCPRADSIYDWQPHDQFRGFDKACRRRNTSNFLLTDGRVSILPKSGVKA